MTPALRWATMRAVLMFYELRARKSQDSVHETQPFWRERRAEAESSRGPSAYQLNALPLGQTGSIPGGVRSTASLRRLWFVDTLLWLCPPLPTDTLRWLSSLPILMQKSFWWWQCNDRYVISLSPHLHTPRPLLPVLNKQYGFCGR